MTTSLCLGETILYDPAVEHRASGVKTLAYRQEVLRLLTMQFRSCICSAMPATEVLLGIVVGVLGTVVGLGDGTNMFDEVLLENIGRIEMNIGSGLENWDDGGVSVEAWVSELRTTLFLLLLPLENCLVVEDHKLEAVVETTGNEIERGGEIVLERSKEEERTLEKADFSVEYEVIVVAVPDKWKLVE